MEFLSLNHRDYQDLFKTYKEDDFTHFHCDICELPHKSKINALNCCSQKKVRLLEILNKKGIKPKKLLKNIDKLDELFQKNEFGRNKHNFLFGSEYYPFYNLMFLKTLQVWKGEKEYFVSDITNMGLYKPKDCYNKIYRKWCKRRAIEIRFIEKCNKDKVKRLASGDEENVLMGFDNIDELHECRNNKE